MTSRSAVAKLRLTRDSLWHGKKIAQRMEAAIRRVARRERTVALLLSGGMDSAVAGMAAEEAGYRVRAYTFQLGDRPSFDSKHAAAVARSQGWDHQVLRVPDEPEWLERAWPVLYRDLRCRKKREFECGWPFLWVYPRVEEHVVVGGLFSDHYFALSRKAYKAGVQGGPENLKALQEFRRSALEPLLRSGRSVLSDDYNPSCYRQHVLMHREANKVYADPFLDLHVYRYLNGLCWDDLNRPRQKHVLAGAYPKRVAAAGHRNHRSYQLAGGVSAHFERHLLATDVNYRKRRRVIDACGDWRNYPEEAELILNKIERRYGRMDLGRMWREMRS